MARRDVVPFLRTTPVVLIRLEGSEGGYGMVTDLSAYPWVLPAVSYPSRDALIASIAEVVIAPAEDKLRALRPTVGR